MEIGDLVRAKGSFRWVGVILDIDRGLVKVLWNSEIVEPWVGKNILEVINGNR